MNNGPEHDLELLAKYISAFCKKRGNPDYLSIATFDRDGMTTSVSIALKQSLGEEIASYSYSRKGELLTSNQPFAKS